MIKTKYRKEKINKSYLFDSAVGMQHVDGLVCPFFLIFFAFDQAFAADGHEDVILFK